jgi:hypothetical protein
VQAELLGLRTHEFGAARDAPDPRKLAPEAPVAPMAHVGNLPGVRPPRLTGIKVEDQAR